MIARVWDMSFNKKFTAVIHARARGFVICYPLVLNKTNKNDHGLLLQRCLSHCTQTLTTMTRWMEQSYFIMSLSTKFVQDIWTLEEFDNNASHYNQKYSKQNYKCDSLCLVTLRMRVTAVREIVANTLTWAAQTDRVSESVTKNRLDRAGLQ